MIDIFASDSICPICSGKVSHIGQDERECENGCYGSWDFTRTQVVGGVTLFGKEYFPFRNGGDLLKKEKLLMERIKYWKENDRYIAELMSKE
ncbi:MAG: hypothetical protein K0R18_210 [Bacillales bacterium]|jgi:hypothetical protein|nr:hypothetical protein [Bacillales bacterium]